VTWSSLIGIKNRSTKKWPGPLAESCPAADRSRTVAQKHGPVSCWTYSWFHVTNREWRRQPWTSKVECSTTFLHSPPKSWDIYPYQALRRLYATAMCCLFLRSFVCRQRVLVGHWPDWPSGAIVLAAYPARHGHWPSQNSPSHKP